MFWCIAYNSVICVFLTSAHVAHLNVILEEGFPPASATPTSPLQSNSWAKQSVCHCAWMWTDANSGLESYRERNHLLCHCSRHSHPQYSPLGPREGKSHKTDKRGLRNGFSKPVTWVRVQFIWSYQEGQWSLRKLHARCRYKWRGGHFYCNIVLLGCAVIKNYKMSSEMWTLCYRRTWLFGLHTMFHFKDFDIISPLFLIIDGCDSWNGGGGSIQLIMAA